MAIITTEDIYSRIYEEIVTEITRDTETLVTRAINAAISEVKMYLSRYDLTALFGTTEDEPTVEDIFLKSLCVDVAVWQLVKLGHPSIDYEHTKSCYEMAIAALKNIQAGKAMPDGWPYKETSGQTSPNGNAVHGSYQSKRTNNF